MKLSIYLPTEMDGYEHALTHVQQQLADRFGGFTQLEGKCGWDNGKSQESAHSSHKGSTNGNIVTEPVTVIHAFGDVSHDNAVIFMDSVAEYAMGSCHYDEDAIMFAVNNSQYLVSSASDGDDRLACDKIA